MKQLANILIGLTILICTACGTGLRMNKSYCIPIDDKYSGTFPNRSYKANDGNCDMTLLQLFNIFDSKTDSVMIEFDKVGQLQITFRDSLSNLNDKTRIETFQGYFSHKGYYEIYLKKEKKEIPPLFPIIYSDYNIDRIRIAFTTENDLIIDNKWKLGGNIFLMAAGDSDRTQYFFKKSDITK